MTALAGLPIYRRIAEIEEGLRETIGRAGNVDIRFDEGETIARVIDYDTFSPEKNGFAYSELNLTRLARDLERWLS